MTLSSSPGESKVQKERELDCQIAERVFGYTVDRDWPSVCAGGEWFAYDPTLEERYRTRRREQYTESEHWYRHPDNHDYLVRVPDFSTSIAAAWLIVDEMRKRGWMVTVLATQAFDVVFEDWHRTGVEYGDDAITAPLAICLASLRALENAPSSSVPSTGGEPNG